MDSSRTMKHYYTDPLAAAWQAKYHGMQFETFSANSLPQLRNLIWDECIIGDGGPAARGKYCIHPDSLRLLEPIIGDLVVTPIAGLVGAIMVDEVCLSAFQLSEYKAKLKIIQRNNIPFMWPLTEEV